MVSVEINITVTVGFRRVKQCEAPAMFPLGSSLWFVLPQATNERVRRAFGTGLAGQDRVKYSESIFIRSSHTGIHYTLYKSYGVWRVGAADTNEADRRALCKLLEETEC